jgi:dolichyl-phosphate beta-glucosyltransferase
VSGELATATDPEVFLSVIIPAYNEEGRLPDSLRQIGAFLGQQAFRSEVLVVDDGSTDGTARVVEDAARQPNGPRLVRVPHGGKGHACKAGILTARGQWLFLCDSDLSMPIEELARLLPHMNAAHEIVIASREVDGAQRHGEPPYRHVMGRGFNWLVQTMAVRGIRDTQCGFKAFRATAARELVAVQTISGWAFDVELLYVARKRGYRIREVGINWYHRGQSKVRPVHDAVAMFREVWQIQLNDRRGAYDYRPMAESRGA